jgi:hypothetical protein
MKASQFQYTFDSVVSFDDGETVQPVTVAYDYVPEERNYPDAPDEPEFFDVFVFDASGNDITYDVAPEETDRFLEEAKEDFAQVCADASAY